MGLIRSSYISTHYISLLLLLKLSALSLTPISLVHGSNLTAYFELDSTERAQFVDAGQEIQISLDEVDGSGFTSYSKYLFGIFNMRFKMVPGYSAGTVTTYYFSSLGDTHDELDFEFLGNVSGQPVILQTNVYAHGVGNREQRIYLWFDPTQDFHNYTILWNTHQVVFYVDEVPIRVYPNIEEATGVPYLNSQPMNIYGTIWDGDSWATEGGRIKVNWTYAPFTASYSDFTTDACTNEEATAACVATKWWNTGSYEELDASLQGQLSWVKENYMVYDYCTDHQRFNTTPIECFYTTPTPTPPTPPSITPSTSPTTSTSPSSSSSSSSSPSSSSSGSSVLLSPALSPSSSLSLHSASPPCLCHHSLSFGATFSVLSFIILLYTQM